LPPEKSKTILVQFISSDSIKIEGKLWLPIGKISDKLVIYVSPCLVTKFSPELDSKRLRYDLMLRDKLLKKGYVIFEFVGRKDSIMKYGRRYPTSTMNTKAQDLEAAIAYIRARADLKNKKIVLIGQSEGGATSAIAASRVSGVHAVVLLSTPGVPGREFLTYQSKCQDTLFMGTFGTDPKLFVWLNLLSSIKKKNYEQSIDGFNRFRKETYGPLEEIVDNYNNSDTIAVHIISYLERKWKKEDDVTRSIHKNFINYCEAHHQNVYIQPKQIALWKWKPELYFPGIKCPVLTVAGSRDQSVEYSSSIKNIRELLAKGGNNNFTSFILKDHDHILENRRTNPSIQDSSVVQVVDWIVRQ